VDHAPATPFNDTNYHAEGEEAPEPEEFAAEVEEEGEAEANTSKEEDEMQEDETIEDYEDRVLNKRAAQLHRHLSKRLTDQTEITLGTIIKKNNRKQCAQKFYSLLVLQKVMAADLVQDPSIPYADLIIRKGPKFDTAAQSL
jgi:cohesin complex subunit SCC1